MGNPIIAGAGLVTPLGLGAIEHAFYIRAAVAAPAPAGFETGDGERIDALHCGFLGATSPLPERLARLSELAAHQALAPWEAAGGAGGLALAFVAPSRPVGTPAIARPSPVAWESPSAISDELSAQARERIARRTKASLVQTWTGAAGAFAAIAQARMWLDAGQAAAVLVIAADSYAGAEALEGFLERRDSPFCPRTPPAAEGAAALLLTSRERARALGLDGAEVLASATARGEGNDDDDAILDGRALTGLIEALPGGRIDLVSGQELTDDLRTRDWFLAYARTGHRFADPAALVSLEEEIGCMGAAAGVAALAYGAALLRHRSFPGLAGDATLLAWAISRDGTRGVAIARGATAAVPAATHGVPAMSTVEPPPNDGDPARTADGRPSLATQARRLPGLSFTRERFSVLSRGEPQDVEGESVEEIDAGLPELGAITGLLEALGAANDDRPTPNLLVRLRKGQGDPVSLAASYEEIVAACLDGIALAARHRSTLRRDRRAREEERILAFTDALVVTPRFVSLLGRWWEEAADLPDPWKVWAPMFAAGCMRGDDVVEGLDHVLGALAEEEAEAAVIAGEALSVTPHPDRHRLASELTKAASPCARAAGLTARSLAGELPMDALLSVLAKETSRTVRWAALQAAARAPEDRRVDEALLAEVHRAEDGDWLWQALRALALRGHATGYHAMRHEPAILAKLGSRALDVLAFFGDAADAALAKQITSRCGLSSPVLRGLGRYGHPGAAPLLLRALGDEDSADDAGDALVWIFGLPIDENDVTSPDAWKTWLRTTRFAEDTRLRFGRPYTPASVAEIAAEGARSQVDVAWMVDEAHVRCGIRGAPVLTGWSPAADAALAPALLALAREAPPFGTDPWRSVTRARRRTA